VCLINTISIEYRRLTFYTIRHDEKVDVGLWTLSQERSYHSIAHGSLGRDLYYRLALSSSARAVSSSV
jgi:hypothetical protein